MSSGNFKFQDTHAKVLDKFGEAVIQAMEEALMLVESEATKNTKRVLTGQMRAGFSHNQTMSFGEYIGRVGSNVNHFIYHELGTGEFAENGGRRGGWFYEGPDGKGHFTRGIKPHPMLRPAFRNNKKEIENKFKFKLKKEF